MCKKFQRSKIQTHCHHKIHRGLHLFDGELPPRAIRMHHGEVALHRNGYEREHRRRAAQPAEIPSGEELADDGPRKTKWVIKRVNENETGSNKHCHHDVSQGKIKDEIIHGCSHGAVCYDDETTERIAYYANQY